MTNNWSLKGKEWNKDWKNMPLMYPKKDIDTLRQKLIDDINENTEWALITRTEMIKQINKRFGVEQDER